jgi:hypothetical protein
VPGHVPRYLNAFDVRANAPNSVGTLQFVRGASLSGRIGVERGFPLKATTAIRVTLSPVSAVRTAQQRRDVTLTTRPDAKGFFHFAGVPPGDYYVQAVAPGGLTETQVAKIIADREAELRQPLLLAAPKTLTVNVTPLLSPSGKPWRISLTRRDIDDRAVLVTESAADAVGTWTYRGAAPGTYAVSVQDEARSVYATRDADMTHDLEMAVVVQLTPLTGEVRLGDKPVSGTVTFTGMAGLAVTIPVKDDGTFDGALPSGQTADWLVTVDSRAYGIHRELSGVRPSYDADGRARAVITLPNGQITGVVRLEAGTLVTSGWVNVTSADGTEVLMQPRVQADGRFILNGLPDGEYSLQAEAVVDKEPMQSSLVKASLQEGIGDDVTLTLRRDRTVRGVVASQAAPVVGAAVFLAPTDVAWLFAAPRTTDLNGRFEMFLPNGSSEVDVFVKAAGFTTRLFHTRVGQEEIRVRLAQTGGELRLSMPPWSSDDPRAPQPWVIHDGAVVHALMMGREQWGKERVTIDAGHVDPGVYSLCLAPIGLKDQLRAGAVGGLPCATSMVPPYGQVELQLGSTAAKKTE